MKPHLRKNQQAFTLLEVLVALLLFAFTMIGLGRLLITTVETNRDARRITAATYLAMDKIEELRAGALTMAAYNGLADSPTDELLNEEGELGDIASATPQPGFIYTRTWNVTADVPQPGGTEIVVTVTWDKKTTTGGARDTFDIQLNTIVVAPYVPSPMRPF